MVENLRDTVNMKREPKPKQWDKTKMMTWLQEHPITDPVDVQFIKDTVQSRREAAYWISAAQLLEKDAYDKAVQAWYGPLPMLHLIMALVHSDKIRSAFMKRNDISNEKIVLDNQKSVEKRATTVWEQLSSLWNDENFSPVTEFIADLHSDFTRPISISHSRVSTLSPATPDKVQEKIPTMTVSLQRIIQNWQRSGQGDGGIDIDDNVEEEFGSLDNHLCGALNTRSAFLGNNPSYLLYLWEMLNKYQLLSTAFSEHDSLSAMDSRDRPL